MTKYILVGGYPYKAEDGGKTMCQEAVDGFTEPINVLICLFARQQEQWDKLYEKNRQFFINNLPDIKLNFTLADKHKFRDQIKNTNLLYFSGGDTLELSHRLEKNPGWDKVLNGKTVMGSSAGTDILSTYNYDLQFFKCSDGFGLVPVKTLVHYGAPDYMPPIGWKAACKELKDYKEDLPILILHEGEYKSLDV